MGIYFGSIDTNMSYSKYTGEIEFKVDDFTAYSLSFSAVTTAPKMIYDRKLI